MPNYNDSYKGNNGGQKPSPGQGRRPAGSTNQGRVNSRSGNPNQNGRSIHRDMENRPVRGNGGYPSSNGRPIAGRDYKADRYGQGIDSAEDYFNEDYEKDLYDDYYGEDELYEKPIRSNGNRYRGDEGGSREPHSNTRNINRSNGRGTGRSNGERPGQRRSSSGTYNNRGTQNRRPSNRPPVNNSSNSFNRRESRGTHGKSRKKQSRKIILLVAEIAVLLLLVGLFWVSRTTTKIQKINIKEEDIILNDTVEQNISMKGYRNIALFGIDARNKSLGKGNRSDTIIICSINEDTGEIKLCSVFRDTYLNLGNDSYNKCNAAYAKGGPEQAINMLNMNLDLNITDYVTVGFTGLIEAIDALGGVYVDVTEPEIHHLNNYQISMVGKTTDNINFYADEGKDYIAVKSPGKQKLNGLQATAYCRIRYVGDDYMRARRQRLVLQEIMKVAKEASPSKLNSVLQSVMPNISTSLSIDEMTQMLSVVAKYNVVAEDGFPFETNRTSDKVGTKGSCVIPVNLQQNVVLLQDFLFGNKDYIPSEQVKNYSAKISNDTGYQ